MFGQDTSPCSSTDQQGWPHDVCSRSLGHLLLVTEWRLGLLTGGKTAKTNRAEAWISYRGQDYKNEQGSSLDIKQGVGLREISGIELRLRTG